MTTPRRVDAERNRAKILAAARAAFADPEADVAMAEIARRAGVGPGTLYRNFTDRRELLEALYLDEVDAVCAAATAAPSLDAWLRRFFDYFSSKRLVAAALLEHADPADPFFSAGRARVVAAGEPLLAAAQRSGEVRDDLQLGQVLDMVAAVAKIPGGRAYTEPILDAALAGLRPR